MTDYAKIPLFTEHGPPPRRSEKMPKTKTPHGGQYVGKLVKLAPVSVLLSRKPKTLFIILIAIQTPGDKPIKASCIILMDC